MTSEEWGECYDRLRKVLADVTRHYGEKPEEDFDPMFGDCEHIRELCRQSDIGEIVTALTDLPPEKLTTLQVVAHMLVTKPRKRRRKKREAA